MCQKSRHILFLSIAFGFFCLTTKSQELTRAEANHWLEFTGSKYPDSTRIHALLRLAEFNILKPGEAKADLDSANTYLSKAEYLNGSTIKYEGYIQFVRYRLTKERGDLSQAAMLLDKSIVTLKSNGDNEHLGEAYEELANSKANEKIETLELAAKAYKQAGNVEKQAFVMLYIADWDVTNAVDIQRSQAYADSALKLYQSIHYQQLQGVYVVLAQLARHDKNIPKTLSYFYLALKTAENVHDSSIRICQISLNIGGLQIQSKDYQTAIKYLMKAYQNAVKCDDHDAVGQVVWSVCRAWSIAGQAKNSLAFIKSVPQKYLDPSDNRNAMPLVLIAPFMTYQENGQFDQASKYIAPLINLITKDSSFRQLRAYKITYLALVDYYVRTGQYATAKRWLHQLLPTVFNDPATKLNFEETYAHLSFETDSALHQYRSALDHFLTYSALKDSESKENRIESTHAIEEQFQNEKKSDSIKIAQQDIRSLAQQNELAKAKLRQSNLTRNLTLLAVFSLLIIVALLIRQYRIKNRYLSLSDQHNQLITQKNEALNRLLREKEWLLKEVHHRVKNNLHTVICLLESQADNLKGDALKAIEDSERRIYAMSLIHEKLYQTEDIESISMVEYLDEFIVYLRDSFDYQQPIDFTVQVDPINLGVGQAIPLALIINEAATNSVKHAFKGRPTGAISIRLEKLSENIQLTVQDDGTGFIPDTSRRSGNSLGLQLIEGLSDDLEGELNIRNQNGTAITLLFRQDLLQLQA